MLTKTIPQANAMAYSNDRNSGSRNKTDSQRSKRVSRTRAQEPHKRILEQHDFNWQIDHFSAEPRATNSS